MNAKFGHDLAGVKPEIPRNPVVLFGCRKFRRPGCCIGAQRQRKACRCQHYPREPHVGQVSLSHAGRRIEAKTASLQASKLVLTCNCPRKYGTRQSKEAIPVNTAGFDILHGRCLLERGIRCLRCRHGFCSSDYRAAEPSRTRFSSLPLRSSSQRLLIVVTEDLDPRRGGRPLAPLSARSTMSRFITDLFILFLFAASWCFGNEPRMAILLSRRAGFWSGQRHQ
jgi:hypothetical protein